MDMTISSDTTYELTFTVTDFDVVPIDKIYDMLGKNFTNIILAAHQPDDNNKNTHYHALFCSKENFAIPSDFENKSSQEQSARRAWKKRLENLSGVIRTHYGRVEEYDTFAHYILVKCLNYKSSLSDEYCNLRKEELWCKDNLSCVCKYCSKKNKLPKKTSESLTQFELIMKDFQRERICSHVTSGICPHCYEDGTIQRGMLRYYLKRGKAVPIGRVAEMMLSAKAVLAPTEKDKLEAEDDLMQAISVKMSNNLKIY